MVEVHPKAAFAADIMPHIQTGRRATELFRSASLAALKVATPNRAPTHLP